MNKYMVCIDNNNYKVINADGFEIHSKNGWVRFFVESEDAQFNIAYFMLNNIRAFWKEDRIEKMGD